MSTISLEIPEEILISLKETPENLSRELKILAAVKLFELGKLSSGRAAQLAGISRVEFLTILGRYQVSPFSLTFEQLEQDINTVPSSSWLFSITPKLVLSSLDSRQPRSAKHGDR